MFNFRIIANLLGVILILEGLFMALSMGFSFYYGEDSWVSILYASLITIGFGGLLWLLGRKADKNINKRDGYIIVSLGWILFSLFGALPFVISREIPSFTDAYFETMSGFTTTGASILNDIESMSKGLLFWRSMTHWLGGMGIIVLSLAILPILGIGGMQLFVAEVPGLKPDKIHPRIKETAKLLWGIYIVFTLVEIILLMAGGMNFFESVNHSFATMATGGFSTKQASIENYSPYIQYVITVFMFIAGMNFTLAFFAFKLNFKKIYKDEEFRFYFLIILFFILLVTGVHFSDSGLGFEQSFRESAFQVVSIITTTGFITADYLQWGQFLILIFLLLMFLGGSAGSTAGGMKSVRILLLFKNSLLELKRLVHPNAIIPVRFNNSAVSSQIISNVLAFIVFYVMIFVSGTLIMTTTGLDIDSSMGATAATLGNVGPGIGTVGPIANYAHVSDFGKWMLSFFMLLGRLEIFTVLILFAPSFWKK
ncbi:MAG: potassium transporter [Bacteroidetes bacterium GWF2_38_335]|nr:MAG: potassium transporter [Bacteroidetes bacterium GWF2_38_335]OFY78301.1 MAG: potassium transporter [Bacteroidetes bacterium RIFOXYA12_FULL_38_20]